MINKLKKIGLRATPQRLAVLEFLKGNTSHPSAEEIYQQLKPKFPSLSLATIYNTLDVLVRASELQEITIDPKRRHFDPNPLPHSHFLCINCKRVYDLEIDIAGVKLPLEVGGFEVSGYSIHFYGTCSGCRDLNK